MITCLCACSRPGDVRGQGGWRFDGRAAGDFGDTGEETLRILVLFCTSL